MTGLLGACADNCPWTISPVVLHDRERASIARLGQNKNLNIHVYSTSCT